MLILTDDQDVVLNEMLDSPLGPMAKTKALLQDTVRARGRADRVLTAC